MSEERGIGSREISPVPYAIDSTDPPRVVLHEGSPASGQVTPFDEWEGGSDVMESLSSDISPPPDSLRGNSHSQDSWNGDDEGSLSGEAGDWLHNDTRSRMSTAEEKSHGGFGSSDTEPNNDASSSLAELPRLTREIARTEPPPNIGDENDIVGSVEEAMLEDEDDSDSGPPALTRRYHSDNEVSMRRSSSSASSSSDVNEESLLGPIHSARTPRVFIPRRPVIYDPRRHVGLFTGTPKILAGEGNNENFPGHSSSGKRRGSMQRPVVLKSPIKLPTKTRLNIHIKKWSLGATWKWNARDENCGICRMPFEACCTECKTPGDDCPLAVGTCKHSFHMHCIVKWTETQNSPRPQCPLCRQEWVFAT